MDLLKHGDDGDGVHRSDQAAKEQILQQADVQVAYDNAQVVVRGARRSLPTMIFSRVLQTYPWPRPCDTPTAKAPDWRRSSRCR